MKRAIALALLVGLPVYGQPTDVPVKEPGGAVLVLKAGAVVPMDGVFMDDASAITAAKRLAAAEAEVAVYRKAPLMPVWAVVLLTVAAAASGAGVTVAIYEGMKAKQ